MAWATDSACFWQREATEKYSLRVSAVPELWGWLSFRRGSWATSEEGVGRRLAVLWPCFGRGLAAVWPRLTVGRVVGLATY